MNKQSIENNDNSTGYAQEEGPSRGKLEWADLVGPSMAGHLAANFVRKNGKYLHVDCLNAPLTYSDATTLARRMLQDTYQLKEEQQHHYGKAIASVFDEKSDDPSHRIQLWSGEKCCSPSSPSKVIPGPVMASINTWRRPQYRRLTNVKADMGMLDDFLDRALVEPSDKAPLIDFMTWNLRNEADKPAWAPFLYSREKGTGKSTLCTLWSKLLGEENTFSSNGIEALSGRFAMPFMEHKGVILEELNINVRYSQWNKLKSFISEKSGSAERKGVDLQKVKQCACVMLTSNNYPDWLEANERRVRLIDFGHSGHASGPDAVDFAQFMSRFHAWMEDENNIAGLYLALKGRELSPDFDPRALNISKINTPLMQQIAKNSSTVRVQQLEELLADDTRAAISQAELVRKVKSELSMNDNQLPHLMQELGWSRSKLKWGKKDYTRAIWVKDGYTVHRGRVTGPDGYNHEIDCQPGSLKFELVEAA